MSATLLKKSTCSHPAGGLRPLGDGAGARVGAVTGWVDRTRHRVFGRRWSQDRRLRPQADRSRSVSPNRHAPRKESRCSGYLRDGPLATITHRGFHQGGLGGLPHRPIDYRPSSRMMEEIEIDDSLEAVNQARKLLFVDPNQLGILGGSLGGQVTYRRRWPFAADRTPDDSESARSSCPRTTRPWPDRPHCLGASVGSRASDCRSSTGR